MDPRKRELAEAPIGRLLAKYSTPAIVAMCGHALYNLVDAIFVGRGAGPMALGALAIAFPVQMFVLATAQVVGIGSASLISRSLGAGDARRAERTAGSAFVAVVVLALLLTVVTLAGLRPLLRLFGATEEVMPFAVDYLSILMGGCLFFAFSVCTNNMVRAEGGARVAMTSMLLGAAANIVLDPLFIFGLGWGIRGAAIATVIANFCCVAYLCRYFITGRSLLKVRVGDLRPAWDLMPEVFSVGASSFTRVAAGSVVAIVLNNSIAYYGDSLHFAIFGIAHRCILFMFMPLIGLVQGFQPIVGFNYGAGNYGRVRQALRTTALAATLLATAGYLAIQFFAPRIYAVFTTEPMVLEEGPRIMRLILLMLPAIGFQVTGATLFQALGRAFPALFLSMARQVLYLTPLLLLFPLWQGLEGVWCAIPAADALAVLTTAVWVAFELRRLNRREAAQVETEAGA